VLLPGVAERDRQTPGRTKRNERDAFPRRFAGCFRQGQARGMIVGNSFKRCPGEGIARSATTSLKRASTTQAGVLPARGAWVRWSLFRKYSLFSRVGHRAGRTKTARHGAWLWCSRAARRQEGRLNCGTLCIPPYEQRNCLAVARKRRPLPASRPLPRLNSIVRRARSVISPQRHEKCQRIYFLWLWRAVKRDRLPQQPTDSCSLSAESVG
jgi:hypothetical protein